MLIFLPRKEVETVIHSDSDFATVAYLRVKEAELEAKDTEEAPELPVPPILEEKYSDLLEDEFGGMALEISNLAPGGDALSRPSKAIFPTRSRQVRDWVSVSNVQRTSDISTTISIEDEVTECFQLLSGTLPHTLSVAYN